MEDVQVQTRREFIRSAGRYLALGGVFAVGGTLFTRRQDRQEIHDNPSICQTCELLGGCELPAALTARDWQSSGPSTKGSIQ